MSEQSTGKQDRRCQRIVCKMMMAFMTQPKANQMTKFIMQLDNEWAPRLARMIFDHLRTGKPPEFEGSKVMEAMYRKSIQKIGNK